VFRGVGEGLAAKRVGAPRVLLPEIGDPRPEPVKVVFPPDIDRVGAARHSG